MKNIVSILISSLILLMIACNNASSEKKQYLDPVCGMNAFNSSLTFLYKDTTYHFCSESCKEKFVAKPQDYLNENELRLCRNLTQEKDYADSVNMGLISIDTLKGSPRRHACYKDESISIDIDYGSPGVKERIVWGGLVPYNQVWVAGAHTATKITFSDDVMIDDKSISKGTYAYFAIPDKEDWTIILNKNYQQHLADDYQASEDVIRVKVKPEISKELIPRLSFNIHTTSEKKQINIQLQWEYMSIHLPVFLEK